MPNGNGARKEIEKLFKNSVEFDGQTGVLKSPVLDEQLSSALTNPTPLPSEIDKNWTKAQLYDFLQQYGIIDPPENLRADQLGKAEILSNTENQQFLQAFRDGLVDKKTLRKMARKTAQRYQIAVAIDNEDLTMAQFVRVGEGDDSSCAGCEELNGFVGTWAEHVAAGLPGSQQCGSMCRCTILSLG